MSTEIFAMLSHIRNLGNRIPEEVPGKDLSLEKIVIKEYQPVDHFRQNARIFILMF